jgi:hypothetical protein
MELSPEEIKIQEDCPHTDIHQYTVMNSKNYTIKHTWNCKKCDKLWFQDPPEAWLNKQNKTK